MPMCRAIYYAVKHGAKIINLSVGLTPPGEPERVVIDWAIKKGVLIVAASGTQGKDTATMTPACLPGVLTVLGRLRATQQTPDVAGEAAVVAGEIPAGQVHDLQQQLPALTRGEGVLESEFARYQRVRGEPPARRRTDHDPLDRRAYLLHVQRGVAAP